LSACRRQYPGRTDGNCSLAFPSTSAFPRFAAGQLLHHLFRQCCTKLAGPLELQEAPSQDGPTLVLS